MQRSAGILLHPTSLPGPFPVGDLGTVAYRWIDWLAEAGVTWWQMLPINPPGFAASPYQATSAFAGNPLLISPEQLLADGLLDTIPAAEGSVGPVDFERAEAWKSPLLAEAADRLPRDDRFASFRRQNSAWLDDYALFHALKAEHGGGSFFDWPDPIRKRDPGAIEAARTHFAAEIDREAARQFLFFDQWARLRTYASERGVHLMGDVPIFVASDSADFWTRPELFDLDGDGDLRVVAGVPPDYFAETGQLWGNPLYDWDAHRADGYSWWIARLRKLLELVDLVRIDHFRAFADFWEVPADSPTAEQGRWVPGPGEQFFEAVRAGLGGLPFIAEDLGEVHAIVPELRDAFGLPGMKVAQFSFTTPPDPPSAWPTHTIGYTGTHDNDTTRGWWATASEVEKERAAILEGVHHSTISADLLRAVWQSNSAIAFAPIQDVLDLDTEARMNLPGTVGSHNWTWRLGKLPGSEEAARMRRLNADTGR